MSMIRLAVHNAKVRGDNDRLLLSIDSFTAAPGEVIGVFGPSGAGKSTFLSMLSGLIPLHQGKICWGELDLATLSISKMDKFRRESLGMIFQEACLFEELSALENSSISAAFCSPAERKDILERARYYLAKLNLPTTQRKVVTFSGGERQRVAVARALATEPKIILADEPTASLDKKNRNLLIEDLLHLVRRDNRTLIMVSHDQEALARMDRTIEIGDGKIINDSHKNEV